ncbi:4'-phosphopantetheinyl transferase superfamily protein [Massilia sp. TW-1]|uniref:4'-phosphopantetheinyl transferase superfamily protein n=1 Tax=Telluria antibiotica TaxID=2717319 RepID=A0ABX0PFA0_9BURK|nr:4'-phosphopantetheinyl transferase superfamily protein [Telluria antibiotica]
MPVRWWADGAFIAPPAGTAALHVVGVRGMPDRATARRTIRAALLAALADTLALPAARIRLGGEPGEAPYALVDDGRRIDLAISHDGDVSLAALRLDGAGVGVDVMRVANAPDWHAVARDYLGPACAAALAGVPAPARAAAFARAWSEREARLKCRGLALAEWRADLDVELAACRCLPLAVPDGYVATLALA